VPKNRERGNLTGSGILTASWVGNSGRWPHQLGPVRGHPECVNRLSLARQRPGTSELDRTSRHPVEERSTSEPASDISQECGHEPSSCIGQESLGDNSFTEHVRRFHPSPDLTGIAGGRLGYRRIRWRCRPAGTEADHFSCQDGRSSESAEHQRAVLSRAKSLVSESQTSRKV
jgi:hypothetical protein